MVSILSDTQFSEYHFESKCRVCLTDLLGDITDLNSPLNNETDDLLIYEALETVMGEDVPMGQDYPNGICGMCLSLLSIAYDLKLQYFKSKNKLLTLCTEGQNVENSNNLSFAIKYDQDNDLSNGSTEFKINIAVQHQEDYVESPESPENIQEISDDDTEEATNEQHVFQTKVEVENQEDSSIIDFVPHTYNMEPLEEVSVDLSCCYCKRTFSTAHYLKKHKIVCEKFNNLECYVCKMKFEEKKALISHIKSLHLINEKKSVKKKNSNSINAVVRVVEKIPEDLLCKICNKLCSNKKTLAYHISTHKEKQFGCEECGKMFSTKNLVEKHMQTHKRETKVICPVCGKSFHYDSGLFYHMKIHNNERKYQCSFCTKTFYNMCGLKRHERTHTGEKPFKCQFCGRGFRSTGERKSHVYLHTGERPFRCSLCSVGFTKPYNLNIHLMTHEGEHKCSVCKKGFITPETLSYHLKIKHGIKADERGAIDNEDIDEEEGDEDRNMNVTEEEETIEVDDYYAHYYEEVPEEF